MSDSAEALRLARPIIEADLCAAVDHADADWEGMSRTALAAIDAALSPEASALRATLLELLNGIGHPTLGLDWTLPWRVQPCDGKPTIVSHKGGNLFRGYIGTWKEAELIVAVVNALPQLLNPCAAFAKAGTA